MSVMVTGLLNVGTTELYTTQNYYLSRVAHYTAVWGIERTRKDVGDVNTTEADPNDPDNDAFINTTSGVTSGTGLTKRYYKGTLEQMEASMTEPYDPRIKFDGIDIQLPGMSLGAAAPVLLLINITAKAKVGRRTAYSELQVGVLSFLSGASGAY